MCRAGWPAAAIDFTAKMQILYMINKGVERISDNKEINNFKACEAANIDEAKHGMLKDDDTTSFRY